MDFHTVQDEKVAACFRAVNSQRANDADWHLGKADEIFDVAGKLFRIWPPSIARKAVKCNASFFEKCLSLLQAGGGMIIAQRNSVAEWFHRGQAWGKPFIKGVGI